MWRGGFHACFFFFFLILIQKFQLDSLWEMWLSLFWPQFFSKWRMAPQPQGSSVSHWHLYSHGCRRELGTIAETKMSRLQPAASRHHFSNWFSKHFNLHNHKYLATILGRFFFFSNDIYTWTSYLLSLCLKAQWQLKKKDSVVLVKLKPKHILANTYQDVQSLCMCLIIYFLSKN